LDHLSLLPCEIFVLRDCHAPELSEVNCHAKLGRSKELLKNIQPVILASFCSLTKTFAVATLKNPQNDQLYTHPSTKKKYVVTKRLHTRLMFSL